MSLFNNPPAVVKALILFVCVFVFALGGWKCAHAESPYVQFSAGRTLIRGDAPVLDLAFTWTSPQSTRDFWKTSLTLIGDSNWRGEHAPNNFAMRALYVTGFRYFDLGLGLAWLQNPEPFNGSPVNFTLEGAYRFQRVPLTLTYTHVSNAGTRMPNYGRDMIMLGYRFRE